MTKLLSCPFCGEREDYPPRTTRRDILFYVECGWCGLESPEHNSKENALDYWNNRPNEKINSGRKLTESEKNLLGSIQTKFTELEELIQEAKLLF
jgi:Lar family restriction alleviation protein